MLWRGAPNFTGARSPELRLNGRTLAWTPTDPLAAREWNLAAVNAFAYADTLPSLGDASPITVAVIDSGIDRTSPDLAGVVPLAPIDEAKDPTTSLVHGTAVAGIIAADADNGLGGVGVGAPYVKLVDYRVVSGGDVDPEVEAQAIRDAVGAGAKVINLSLGGNRDPKVPALDEFSRAERDAISYAVRRGAVVVAAVGNSTQRHRAVYASWPAALRARDRRLGRQSAPGLGAVLEHRFDLQRHRGAGRRHHHDRAAVADADGLVAGRAGRHDGRHRRHRASARRSPRPT